MRTDALANCVEDLARTADDEMQKLPKSKVMRT